MRGEAWARDAAIAGAGLAGLAVLAGAFGAHALRDRLAPGELEVYETAARYQMYHGLALLLLSTLLARWPARLLRAACWLFVGGTALFSGSLYAIALTGHSWLGAFTPIGGFAFLAGWACVALGSLAPGSRPPPGN